MADATPATFLDFGRWFWEREQRIPQVETAILGYVQDVVLAEIEYRRRMRDLDRRLTELESTSEAGVSILSP